ncbi:SDR family oxidoreductase [Terriglobus aquaticus]|uniref:SDR family oxidoreductase n=1 Tax=Terriglobus aquaticus TaxID=940139 RepID=A0ABW9KG35_9BACT|nr:SDR family oxidoreductase [Terriglobus aquaticus]
MRVFVTGATGFIGSRVVPELIGAGHTVLGMTRSNEGAERLMAAGAEPYHANIDQPESLKEGAASADGVIHLAFDHDFSRSANAFAENAEKDRVVITTLADVLAGTNKPLVITSGVGLGSKGPGQTATEDFFDASTPVPRKFTELAGIAAQERGVNVSVVRLPQVHDPYKQGLITYYNEVTRKIGIAGYVGDGANRYSAAPVQSVANLYRLVLERAEAGSRWNAVQEEGVPMKDVVEVVAGVLKLEPKSLTQDEANQHYGWLGHILAWDMPASSAYTQKTLGWDPTGPTLLEDLRQGKF